MNVSIGLIITDSHLPNIKNVEKEIKPQCNLKYLVPQKNQDIINLFKANYNLVDAFIFSGPALYNYLLKNVAHFDKPCYVIYDDVANIYKEILKIFMFNNKLESNRVYIDFEASGSHLELDKLFPEEKTPYLYPWNVEDPESIAMTVLENHKRLWREGKIDLSITKFGMLINDFEKEGIKYHFVYPSEKYLSNLFLNVISEIKLKKLNNNKISSIYICPDIIYSQTINNVEKDILILNIQKELFQLVNDENIEFIIQKKDKAVEVFATIEEITLLTNNFSTCRLQKILKGHLNTTFTIGYGCGRNLTQANLNSQNAYSLAKGSGGDCSFVVEEDLTVIGPLTENTDSVTVYKPDPFIDELSKKINISKSYMLKIISYTKKISSNKLTSKELSETLGIAIRSANRVLNRLVENNFATESYENNKSTKGRPTKYYTLNFIDFRGNILKA